MKPLAHVMILASAGSGKTYALTNRFVELLARGAPAERIVALTFTRKAAGEFFDEILHKLARAAGDEKYAAQLARDIAGGEAPAGCRTTVDFLKMLRAVVEAMPRLRLGTLDGFFARIARCFPFELGLAGDFELLEEHAARLERQRVLRRMFARTGELVAAQKEFIEPSSARPSAPRRNNSARDWTRFSMRTRSTISRRRTARPGATRAHLARRQPVARGPG